MARAARVLAAVVLGLALAELGLRAAGRAYLAGAGRVSEVRAAGPDGLTLLCLGDSNTFGMFEEAADAWPARLQALLDERVAGAPHAVRNLGMPGMTTGHVVQLLERELAGSRPDAVLVLAGVNNAWGWRGDQDVERGAAPEPPWYEELRLWKTARLLRHRLATRGAAADPFDPAGRVRPGDLAAAPAGPGRGERIDGRGRQGDTLRFEVHARDENLAPDEHRRSVRRDLARAAALADAAGTPLVLLTYAGDRAAYGEANAAIRAAADELGAPLVECAAPTAAAIARHGYDALLYPDQHPRAAGYELVARLVLDALLAAGIAPGPPAPALLDTAGSPLEGLPVDAGAAPPVRLVRRPEDPAGPSLRSADAVRLEITGEEPGRTFRLVLSNADEGPPAQLHGLVLPVRDDALYRETLDLPVLTGTFDEQGRASLPVGVVLGPERLARLADRPVRVAYLTYVDPNRRRVRWFSDGVELRTVHRVAEGAADARGRGSR